MLVEPSLGVQVQIGYKIQCFVFMFCFFFFSPCYNMYFYQNFGQIEASTARQVSCQTAGQERKVNIIALSIVFEKAFIYLLFTSI